MILRNTKLFKLSTGIFILLAYISIGAFGLFQFSHMTSGPMANCPYAQNSFSVCENNLSHIDNWHQFSNAIFPAIFLLFLLAFSIILYFFDKRKFFNQILRLFYRWKYYLDNDKLYSFPNKIIKWLALLENSPSFSPRT